MPADFRYRQLGYIVLNVTDLEKSTHFADKVFGLDPMGETGNMRFFRAGHGHHDIVLQQAGEPSFVRSSWELESEADLDKAFTHYSALGLDPKWLGDEEASNLRLERAFRFVDPVLKTTFEYYSKMAQYAIPRKNTLTQFQGGKHFGLTVPNVKMLASYMVENMGFLVSDYWEGWPGCLMRAFPSPNHHSFAPLQMGGRLGFHHVAFMVKEIDDIGRLVNRIKLHDVKVQFGIGRHPTSGSIHLYVYGPDLFVWEYTLGMEQFPELNPREPRRMVLDQENFDWWGALPDQEYAGRNPPYLVAA